MRPAVHASILRNRSQRPRARMRPHTFSLRRLLLLACVGAVICIPGIVISIVGLEKAKDEVTITPGEKIMFQAIGPALTTIGIIFLFCSCIYYYCYGTGESNRLPGGSHQKKKSVQGSINSDQRHHHHGHQSHVHNGHQLNTPDGAVRRASLKSDQFKPNSSPNPSPHSSPHPSPNPGHRFSKQEEIPLTSSQFTKEQKQQSSPPTIRIDQAPEADSENEAHDRELLVNGDIPNDEISIV